MCLACVLTYLYTTKVDKEGECAEDPARLAVRVVLELVLAEPGVHDTGRGE